jgi:hypothetical protein
MIYDLSFSFSFSSGLKKGGRWVNENKIKDEKHSDFIYKPI